MGRRLALDSRICLHDRRTEPLEGAAQRRSCLQVGLLARDQPLAEARKALPDRTLGRAGALVGDRRLELDLRLDRREQCGDLVDRRRARGRLLDRRQASARVAQPRRQLVDATVQVCHPSRSSIAIASNPAASRAETSAPEAAAAARRTSRSPSAPAAVAADHVAKVLLHDAGRDLGRTRCLRSCVPDDHVERGDPLVHIAVERFERLHRRHAFHPLLKTGDAGDELALDAIEPLPGREPGDSILELAPEPCSRRLQIPGEAVDARRGRMRSVGEVVVARSELRETQIGDCRELVEPATELGREAFELRPLRNAVQPALHRPEPTTQLRNRTLHRSNALVQRQRLDQRPHLVDPRTKITRKRNDLRPPDRILQTGPYRVEARGEALDLGTLRNAVQPALHRPEPTRSSATAPSTGATRSSNGSDSTSARTSSTRAPRSPASATTSGRPTASSRPARTASRRAARLSTSERSATPSSRPCTDPSQPRNSTTAPSTGATRSSTDDDSTSTRDLIHPCGELLDETVDL